MILHAGQPRQGWDDLREHHWNMCITIRKIDKQYKFHAWSRALKASALGQPRGIWRGGRWEESSGLPHPGGSTCIPGADSCLCMASFSRSVISDSLWPHGLQPASLPTRLLSPWDYPGKNTGVGFHFLLQRIFPTWDSNLCLLHCRWILYHRNYQGSPCMGKTITIL